MDSKLALILIVFHVNFCSINAIGPKKSSAPQEDRSVGWFARRNYTSYCHGGNFETGLTDSYIDRGVQVFIDNETRCTLRKLGGSVAQGSYGVFPPPIIRPADCGVFWASSDYSGQSCIGWQHYMCEEYGVVIALEFTNRKIGRNSYGLMLRAFGGMENVIHMHHEGSDTTKASLNIFLSEKKRFCPCIDQNIFVDYDPALA